METVYYNAVIHTMDERFPIVEALAVAGGRIVAAGSSREMLAGLPPSVERIDLGGRAVVPGLVDAHAHFLGYAEKAAWIDLGGTASPRDVLERVAAARAEGSGGWILGRGWDQNDWPDPSYPGRSDLDAAAGDRPAYLVRVCGHAAWVSSAALRIAGIDRGTADPPGGRILRGPDGEPSGILLDNAMDLVRAAIPPLDAGERKRLLREAAARCLAAGLVGAHEMGISAETVRLYRELYAEGALPFRVTAYLEGGGASIRPLLEEGPRTDGDFFSIVGVKFYADGSLGARSAALLEDYADDPGNRGILMQTPDSLFDAILRCQEKGFQAAVHAIGDAAVREALDVYERLLAEHPAPDRRHRIEHAQIVDPADIPRFARLGVVPSMQFVHCVSDLPWVGARIGPARERGAYAWRSLMDAGSRIPGGSDFPVESIDPRLGIHAAIARTSTAGEPAGGWHPEERLTVAEAVRAFTVEAAWVAHREAIAGSLSPGKLADFVVLSEDPFAVEASAVPRTRVLATVLGGSFAFRAGAF